MHNSHIIPEFEFKLMYDEKHRFLVASSDSTIPEKLAQKGFREYLLCYDCEQKFSKWESYTRNVLYGNEASLEAQIGSHLVVGDIEYASFKLYLMSLIWRMGISSLPIFSPVDLGPYEERLRMLLVANDPGEPHQFPCIVSGLTLGGKMERNWIIPPSKVKCDGSITAYRFAISGVHYLFHVTEKIPPFFDVSKAAIGKEGRLVIEVNAAEEIPYIAKFFQVIGKALNDRPQELRKQPKP